MKGRNLKAFLVGFGSHRHFSTISIRSFGKCLLIVYVNMHDEYVYTKERREFGRQCLFADYDEDLLNEPPDKSLYSQYIRRVPADASTQLSVSLSGHEVTTDGQTFASRGMCHIEGGWPKDLNPLDEEQTLRYRRRVERDDQFDVQMKRMLTPMEAVVEQNNAVNVYQRYFNTESVVAPKMKTISVEAINRFVDVNAIKRRASHVSFSPNHTEMVVSYSMTHYKAFNVDYKSSFIWDINYSHSPVMTLETESLLITLEYNPREEYLIGGGMANGCVCLYDTRVEGNIQSESVMEDSHYAEVTALQWIDTNSTELFTCSIDGQVMWWDTREFSKPLETLQCGLGCTALEYHPSMPDKFLVGTDSGCMYYGDRRGSSPEEKLTTKGQCYESTIFSVERNPFAPETIMTVGGFRFKIWSEECPDHYTLSTAVQKSALRCGSWNPKRESLLLIGHDDGTLCLWDLHMDLHCPITTIQPIEATLSAVRCHPDGRLVACCYANGDVFLLELSGDLASITCDEQAAIGNLFKRNLKQKKLFLTRTKDIELNRSKGDDVAVDGHDSVAVADVIRKTEEDFDRLTRDE